MAATDETKDEPAVVVPRRLIIDLLNQLAAAKKNLEEYKSKPKTEENVTEQVEVKKEFVKGGPREIKHTETEETVVEEKEERINPGISEDDIAYDIEVSKDDELGEAKLHVHHAESRIHALRARLRKKKKHRTRKSEVEMEMVPDKEKIYETRTITKIIKETGADLPGVSDNVNKCEKIAQEMLNGPDFGSASKKESKQLQQLQSELMVKNKSITEMTAQMKSVQEDLAAQQNQMKEKEVALSKSEALLKARDTALHSKEEELENTKKLMNERDELMVQHEEDWQEKLLNSEMKYKELEASTKLQLETNKNASEEVAKLKADKEKLEIENEELQEGVSNFKILESKLELLESSKKGLENDLQEKDAKIIELQQRQSSGDASREADLKQIQELTAKSNELSSQQEELNLENRELQGQLVAWQTRFEKESGRAVELEQRLEQEAKQISALNGQKEKLGLENQELLVRLGQVEDSLLERQQNSAYRVIEGPDVELETMVTSVVDLRSMDHKIYEAQVLPSDKWRVDVPVYRQDGGKITEVAHVANWQEAAALAKLNEDPNDDFDVKKAISHLKKQEAEIKKAKKKRRRPSFG